MLIDRIEILPALFGNVILPAVVFDELSHPKAPPVVRSWVAAPPSWVEVRQTDPPNDASLNTLDAGEEAAIALAVEIQADLLLMDDEEGVAAARRKGIEVTGTLVVLSRAAARQLLDLAEAFDRLKRTNSRFRREIMQQFLDEQSRIR